MITNTTAVATTSDTAEILLPFSNNKGWYALTIDNHRCAVEGWWSVDGGSTWARIGASSVISESQIYVSGNVMIKRVASGSNITDLWAWMYRARR